MNNRYRKCTGECGLEKEENISNFNWMKTKKRYFSKCIPCEKICAAKCRKSPKSVVTKNKYYKSLNRKLSLKKYKTSDKGRKNARDYARKLYQNDPFAKLRNRMGRDIRGMLVKNESSKGRKSFIKYVDYTLEQLKEHLESLFEPWMNWNNWGKYNRETWNDNDPKTWTWQLDHIVPHSKFKYTSMADEAFKKCWSLSNLRPYSAKQNILDGNRRA